MDYFCKGCKRHYTQKELINYQIENNLVKKYGLKPVCPNCQSKDFKVYDLVVVK